MTVEMFLILLSSFAVITGLITEAIKKIVNEKDKISNNIIALVTSLIVGCVGTSIYYYLNDIVFDGKNVVYIFLLSLASGLTSMLGFDKIKQTIIDITKDSKR